MSELKQIILPTKAEVKRIKDDYLKKPTVSLSQNVQLIYEDPLFTRPLANVPITWCAVQGYFDISADIEEGETILTFGYNDSKGKKNTLRLGLKSINDLNRLMKGTEVFSEVSTQQTKLDLNYEKLYKRTAVVAGTVSMLLAGLTFIHKLLKSKIQK